MANATSEASEEVLSTQTGAERRSQVRFPFRLAISCKTLEMSVSTPWHGECRDLSSHGIRFVSKRRFEPQTVLLIELQSKADLPVRSFLGRVKWAEPGPASSWLLGCSLIHFMSSEEVEDLVRQAQPSSAEMPIAPVPAQAPGDLVRRSGRLGKFVRSAHAARRHAEPTIPTAKRAELQRVDQLLERLGDKSLEIRLPSRRAARTGVNPTPSSAPGTETARPSNSLTHTPSETAPAEEPAAPVPAKALETMRADPEQVTLPEIQPEPEVQLQGDTVAKHLLAQLMAELDADQLDSARETSLALLEHNPSDAESLAVVAYLFDQLDAPGKEGQLRCFKGHSCTVNCVAFSPDGRTGFSGSGGDYVDGIYTDGDDRTLRAWDLAGGRELARFSQHSSPVLSVACTPTGSHVLTASRGGTLCYIDARDFGIFRQLARHRSTVFSLAMAPDGRTALTGCDDGVVRLWDLAGTRLRRFEGHSGPVTCVAFSPCGTWVASGGLDRTVRLWDIESGEEAFRFLGHEKGVLCLAVAPNGQQVLSGSADGSLRMWDAEEGGEVAVFWGHEEAVTALAFTSNGQRILSGGRDKTVRLWDAVQGNELRRFTGHTGAVKSVAASPGGRRALSGGADSTVRLWGLPL